ncbi:ATP-binding protein [Halomicrobium mukohataei]|nr:ATP-binding protein [Halomicrobium mukohataei]
MTSPAQSMSFFMLICAVPIVGLAVYTVRRRDRPGANGLVLCLVGMAGWSVMLALITWPTQLLPVWINTTVRHFFQILVVFGWPLFVREYIERDRVDLSWIAGAVLAVIPALTIVLTATNPLHHLVLAPETPANPAGISELALGPWYIVHIGFAVALVILPVGLLLRELQTAHGAHRKHLLLVLTGWAIGFPGALQTHLFRTIDAIPLYVDLTPLAFLVTAGLWGVSLFRYQLFMMVPVSRRTVVETIPDPVVAVDENGLVIDVNPAGKRLFGTPDDVAGFPIEELFADYPSLVEYYRRGSSDVAFELTHDGQCRQFSVTCERIRDGGSEAVLVLRDITPVKQREETLRQREQELRMLNQVFSRVFRHNIRNELLVARGHMDRVGHRTDDETVEESVQTAIGATERLLGHAEKTREIQQIVDSDPDSTVVSLERLVTTAIDPYRNDTTDVTIEVAVDDVHVDVIERFEAAVANAVENAIEHNPTPLHVGITSQVAPDTVTLCIEDDGEGIPDNEIAFLTEGEETVLNHGSGVGLWVLNWSVQRSDGTLSIVDTGCGTRVEMTLQRSNDALGE